MEIISLIAAPTITAFLAPVILEVIKRRIDKKKEIREAQERGTDRNIALADDLRDELRDQNIDLKRENAELRERVARGSDADEEIEKWQNKFYALRKDYRRLSFDVSLMRQELQFLREKYDEYLEIRERAEQQFRRADDEDG